MTLAAAQAYLNPTGGETVNYVSPQDIKDAFSVIYTDLTHSHTAEIQVTRPNTDDVLVKAWDGSAWQTVHYDSGWRGLTLNSPWTGTANIRRVNNTVHLRLAVTNSSSLTSSFFTLPTGFKHVSSTQLTVLTGWNGSSISGKPVYIVHYNDVPNYRGANFDGAAWATGSTVNLVGSWITNDAIPASLPGTLVSGAPA